MAKEATFFTDVLRTELERRHIKLYQAAQTIGKSRDQFGRELRGETKLFGGLPSPQTMSDMKHADIIGQETSDSYIQALKEKYDLKWVRKENSPAKRPSL